MEPLISHLISEREGDVAADARCYPAAESLMRFREKLTKIIRHGRYVVFQMAEVVNAHELFSDILRRIDRLKPKPALA